MARLPRLPRGTDALDDQDPTTQFGMDPGIIGPTAPQPDIDPGMREINPNVYPGLEYMHRPEDSIETTRPEGTRQAGGLLHLASDVGSSSADERETEAIRRWSQPEQTEPQEPPVGVSPLARRLEEEGWFSRLESEHAGEREQVRQRAIEDSQGWSPTTAFDAVSGFFGGNREPVPETSRPRTVREWMGLTPQQRWEQFQSVGRLAPGEREEAARQELETRQRTAPAARRFVEGIPDLSPGEQRAGGVAGGVLTLGRRLFGSVADKQEQALARAQAMVRGEAELPQYAEWRSLTETGGRTIADMFSSLPLQYAGIVGGYAMGAAEGRAGFVDNRLHKFGQEVERAVQQAFPNDPARQFEFSHTLVQGLASTIAFGGQGAIAHLVGAGAKGQLALITLSGMAAQTPGEFARVTQAMERGTAQERDRIIVTLANSALGATESLPFANTIAGNARGLAGRLARGGEQAFEETIQEATQQTGSNLARRFTYDPNQDPYEGVAESMLVAAISGFGYGAAFSGGRGAAQIPPQPASPDGTPVQEARAGGRSAPAPTPQPAAPAQPAEAAPAPQQAPAETFGFDFPGVAEPAPEAPAEAVQPQGAEAAPEIAPRAEPAPAAAPAAPEGAPAVQLPPDVMEALRRTDPELAARYEAPAAAEEQPATLRERLDAVVPQVEETPERVAEIDAIVQENQLAASADMESVRASRNIQTPLSEEDVRAVARYMARDDISAEEALDLHDIAQYEAEREVRGAPETVGRQAAQPAAQAGAQAEGAAPSQAEAATAGVPAAGQPGGARTDGARPAELVSERAGPAAAAAAQPTGGAARGGEQWLRFLADRLGTTKWVVAPRLTPRLTEKGYEVAVHQRRFTELQREFDQLKQVREPAQPTAISVTEPTPAQRTQLRSIIASRFPLNWGTIQARLGTTPEQMEALRQEALNEGVLRQDRDGAYRRVPQGVTAQAGPEISVSPEERVEGAVRAREAQTGKPVSPAVRAYAVELLSRLGFPSFMGTLERAKADAGLTPADARDLAAIAGTPVGSRAGKTASFASVEKRHQDHVVFLEKQAAEEEVGATLAALASGLDMSPEARKARAEQMGFDTSRVWYHGTWREFDAFDSEGLAWFSDNPEVATDYGRRQIASYLRVRNPFVHEGSWLPSWRPIVDRARAVGHDAVIFENVMDRGSQLPQTQLVVFDPTNIRSVNAAFAEDATPMLLASLASATSYGQSQRAELDARIELASIASGRRVEAAIKIGGEIFTAPNHALAMEKATEKLGQDVVNAAYRDLSANSPFRDGFVDEAGNFMTRAETAAYLGLAQPGEDVMVSSEQVQRNLLSSLRDRLGALEERGQQSPPYTDAFAARLPETIPAIESWMRKMLPPEIAVRVVDRLVSGGYNLNARYTFLESRKRIFDRAVEVALNTEQGSVATRTVLVKAFHEINHALREYGRLPGGVYGTLLADKEWQVVVERAKKIGVDEQISILDENGKPIPAIPVYRKLYRDMLRAAGYTGGALEQRVEELINQERVAKAAELWATGTSFGAKIDSFFERIVKFFEAIRNALRGLGIQTYDDVFRSMASGEVARRAEGGRREPTFEPFPYTPSPSQVHLSSEEGREARGLFASLEGPPRRPTLSLNAAPGVRTLTLEDIRQRDEHRNAQLNAERALRGPFAARPELSAWVGLDVAEFTADVDHIARKRREKDGAASPLATPVGTRAHIDDVLNSATAAYLYRVENSREITLNVVKLNETGEDQVVSIRLKPALGRLQIPTAFPQSRRDTERRMAASIDENGADALRWNEKSPQLPALLRRIAQAPAEYRDSQWQRIRRILNESQGATRGDVASFSSQAGDADALRNSVAKARGERDQRLRSKGLRPPATEGDGGQQLASFSSEQNATSRTASLTGVTIDVSPQLTAWLQIPHAPFHANYDAIARKRVVGPSPGIDLSDPAVVRGFVEDVLTRAEIALRADPHTPNQWNLIVRDDQDRAVGVRLTLRAGRYNVATALVYDATQLERRLAGAAQIYGLDGIRWRDARAAATILELMRRGVSSLPSGSGTAPPLTVEGVSGPVHPYAQEVIDALEQSQVWPARFLPSIASERPALDRSPEARKARAEAMGFDTSRVWYRGMPDAGRLQGGGFIPAVYRESAYADGIPTEEERRRPKQPVIHLTDDPEYASWYAQGGLHPPEWEIAPAVFPVYVKPSAILSRSGARGTRGGETITIADPSSIRSVNAVFDPAEEGSPVLLASLASERPAPETRPFEISIPGLTGSVTEKVKEGGERLRTYAVGPLAEAAAGGPSMSGEIPTRSAIRMHGFGNRVFDGDGEHADIAKAAYRTFEQENNEAGMDAVIHDDDGFQYDNGFMTNTGRFVEREEAYKLARNADLIGSRPEGWAWLDSTDLPEISAAASAPNRGALSLRGTASTNLIVSEQSDGSWELTFFKADDASNIREIVSAIEADVGKPISPRGWLTPQGYQYWAQAAPEKVKFHVNAGELFGGMYASPRAVEFAEAVLNQARDQQDALAHLSRLKSSLPQEAFTEARRDERYSFASTPPLDMSPEARKARAEAMGFTREAIHSTEVDFTAFDPSKAGERRAATLGRAVYLAPRAFAMAQRKPRSGYYYGAPQVEGARNIPVLVRIANPFVVRADQSYGATDWESLRQHGWTHREGPTEAAQRAGKDPDSYVDRFTAAVQRAGHDGIIHAFRGEEFEYAVFDPTNIRSVNAAFDPSQEGSPMLLASFAGGGRPPPPVTPSLPTTPASKGEIRGLADIIADLKSALGLTTTQGLYGMRVRDRAGNRSWSFRPQSSVRGQYDANAGVARIRVATDIDAIAEQGGRHIERVFGVPMQAFLNTHAEELAVPPAPDTPLPTVASTGYSGIELDADTQRVLVEAGEATRAFASARTYDNAARAAVANRTLERRLGRSVGRALVADITGVASLSATPVPVDPAGAATYVQQRYSATGTPAPRAAPAVPPDQVSAAFAQFFRRFITDPDGVKRDMPGVFVGFGDFLDAYDPAMLQDLERVQLAVVSEDYKAYREATALERLKADTVSYADQRLTTRLKDWFRRNRRGTATETAAAARSDVFEGIESFASVVYENAVDETHPFYLVTRKLLEQADTNKVIDPDGRAISLSVHENPAKLIRSVGDAFKTGLRWIQDGMPSYRHGGAGFEVVTTGGRVLGLRLSMADANALAATSTEPTSIVPVAGRRSRALRDALALVMGNNWNYQSYENFGAYLIARRAIEEWARFQRGELERPPIKSYVDGQPANEIAKMTEIIRDFETATPSFRQAAEIVYDFLWQQAIHDFQAGRLSQAELDYRATRKHFYVPFSRDMRDMLAERGFGGRSTTFTKDKRFKGSDRSILNPIEAIIDQTFHRAAATHMNEVVGAFARLADRVGPGGGEIAERVTKTELVEANNEGFRQLQAYIEGLGYDAHDAREMVRRVEADFGDTHLLVSFDPTNLGPQRPVLLTLYENGQRQYVRINDPEWAQHIYSSVNGIGRELTSLFIDSVAAPAALLRFGVTTSPAFLLPNIVRDMWSSWILTGGVNPRTWPIVTQVRGLYHELTQTDMARLYQEAAGLMGGQNVAALSKVRDKADVMALRDKGLQIKPVRLSLATAAGAGAGFAFGGPAGAAFGAFLGAGLHRGIGKGRFTDTLSYFSDMSETATRLGVFTEAYKAALAWNPNLTPYQAAQEAAFVARDLIDFGRRGSKMLAAARLVPFMNASIQGLDKAQRALLARSDRGNAFSTTKLTGLMAAGAGVGFAVAGPVGGAAGTFLVPALATNLAARSAAARALLAPFTKKDMGIPLSRDEERAQGQSAKSWANLLVYTLSLIAAGALLHWYTDDEKEYNRIPPRFRFRNQPIKIGGEWHMFPKAFEWAIPSNILEAAIESQRANDPRFWERVRESLYDNLTPPGVPQAVRLWGDVRSNYDTFRDRPIVAEYLRSAPPELQFNAYASRLAIALSREVNKRPAVRGAVESVGGVVFGPSFELTPAVIDYVLRTGGGYWGADIQRFSNIDTANRVTDFPLVGSAARRFVFDPNRVSDALDRYWQLMGREHFGFRRAANGYRQYNEMRGATGANQYLATLEDPEQQAYALLEASGTTGQKRRHPLNRLRGVVEASMDMERDLALERFADTSSPRDPQPIVLSPVKRDEVRDALARIRAIEANNAMVVLQHRQFAGRQILDLQPALEILQAASPEAFREYETRIGRKHVGDFASVQEWPRTREELLKDWREAMDEEAAMVRRPPKRLPVGASRPPVEQYAPQ